MPGDSSRPKKQNVPTSSGRAFLQGGVSHTIRYCQVNALIRRNFLANFFPQYDGGAKNPIVPRQPRVACARATSREPGWCTLFPAVACGSVLPCLAARSPLSPFPASFRADIPQFFSTIVFVLGANSNPSR